MMMARSKKKQANTSNSKSSSVSSFSSITRVIIHSCFMITTLFCSGSSSNVVMKTTTVTLVFLLVITTILHLLFDPTVSTSNNITNNNNNTNRLRHDATVHVQEKTTAVPVLSEHHGTVSGCESYVSVSTAAATLEEDYSEEDVDDNTDDDFDMPFWMSDYVDFHKRHVKKTSTGRGRFQYRDMSGSSNNDDNDTSNGYIKWTCPQGGGAAQKRPWCGGLGDRLYGIVMTLYMAILTNRTLLVQGWWDDNDNGNHDACSLPLDKFLRPAYIQWNAEVVVEDNNVDSSQQQEDNNNVFHVSTMDNSKHPYLQEPCTSIPTHYKGIEIHNNMMPQDAVLKNSSGCFMDYWKNQRRHHDDKQSSSHHDVNDNDNTDNDMRSLFHVGFWTLFRFTPRVYRHADYLREMAGMTKMIVPTSSDDNKKNDYAKTTTRRRHHESLSSSSLFRPYIGVHIRTGQGESWNDPIRHGSSTETLQLFYQCALKLQRGMHQKQQQQQQQAQEQQEQQCPNSTSSNSNMDNSHSTTATAQLSPLPLPDIYLASDNAAAKMQIQHMDKQQAQQQQQNAYIKTLVDLDILHIDRTRVEDLQRNSVHQHADNTSVVLQQAYINVWGELQILLEASCLVTSRSKFTNLAVELHPQQQRHGGGRCVVRFDDCSNEQVARALQNYHYAVVPPQTLGPSPQQQPCK